MGKSKANSKMRLPGQSPATTTNPEGGVITLNIDEICKTAKHMTSKRLSLEELPHFLRVLFLVYRFASPLLALSTVVDALVARLIASFANVMASLVFFLADRTFSSSFDNKLPTPAPTLLLVCLVKKRMNAEEMAVLYFMPLQTKLSMAM
jgi:hypothetical protein